MTAKVSDIFTPEDWDDIPGFDFTDITYQSRDPQRLSASHRR